MKQRVSLCKTCHNYPCKTDCDNQTPVDDSFTKFSDAELCRKISLADKREDDLTIMMRNNETGVECWCNIAVYDIDNAKRIILKRLDKLLEKDFGICNSKKQKKT